MRTTAVWAGVIATDLAEAVAWYGERTGAQLGLSSGRWAELQFRDGSALEIHEGDPSRPGLTFPSYGGDTGPAIMPGYAVDDAGERAAGLDVARALPGWIVVVAPGGLRMVLTDRDSTSGEGLIGFAFATALPNGLRAFLERIGADGDVEHSARARVIPLVAGTEDRELHDPDGNLVRTVRTAASA